MKLHCQLYLYLVNDPLHYCIWKFRIIAKLYLRRLNLVQSQLSYINKEYFSHTKWYRFFFFVWIFQSERNHLVWKWDHFQIGFKILINTLKKKQIFISPVNTQVCYFVVMTLYKFVHTHYFQQLIHNRVFASRENLTALNTLKQLYCHIELYCNICAKTSVKRPEEFKVKPKKKWKEFCEGNTGC